MVQTDWREDPGMRSYKEYKRRFAWTPRQCNDGTTVWLTHFYTGYIYWGRASRTYMTDKSRLHRDLLEHITESHYIIKKLSDNI